MFNLVTKSTHVAALASANRRADNAEAAALRFKRSQGHTLAQCAKLIGENADLTKRVEALEQRLAVFVAPRKRDSRGHFLPAKVAGAEEAWAL